MSSQKTKMNVVVKINKSTSRLIQINNLYIVNRIKQDKNSDIITASKHPTQ